MGPGAFREDSGRVRRCWGYRLLGISPNINYSPTETYSAAQKAIEKSICAAKLTDNGKLARNQLARKFISIVLIMAYTSITPNFP